MSPANAFNKANVSSRPWGPKGSRALTAAQSFSGGGRPLKVSIPVAARAPGSLLKAPTAPPAAFPWLLLSTIICPDIPEHLQLPEMLPSDGRAEHWSQGQVTSSVAPRTNPAHSPISFTLHPAQLPSRRCCWVALPFPAPCFCRNKQLRCRLVQTRPPPAQFSRKTLGGDGRLFLSQACNPWYTSL